MGKGQEPEPDYGTAAYLAWIAHKANKDTEKVRSELFAELQEDGRQLRLEREGKGKGKGNYKEKSKHIEELKSKVNEAREAVLRRRWAHGVVNSIKQCRSCGRHFLGRRA